MPKSHYELCSTKIIKALKAPDCDWTATSTSSHFWASESEKDEETVTQLVPSYCNSPKKFYISLLLRRPHHFHTMLAQTPAAEFSHNQRPNERNGIVMVNQDSEIKLKANKKFNCR
jgi:hypothetical protein